MHSSTHPRIPASVAEQVRALSEPLGGIGSGLWFDTDNGEEKPCCFVGFVLAANGFGYNDWQAGRAIALENRIYDWGFAWSIADAMLRDAGITDRVPFDRWLSIVNAEIVPDSEVANA